MYFHIDSRCLKRCLKLFEEVLLYCKDSVVQLVEQYTFKKQPAAEMWRVLFNSIQLALFRKEDQGLANKLFK